MHIALNKAGRVLAKQFRVEAGEVEVRQRPRRFSVEMADFPTSRCEVWAASASEKRYSAVLHKTTSG